MTHAVDRRKFLGFAAGALAAGVAPRTAFAQAGAPVPAQTSFLASEEPFFQDFARQFTLDPRVVLSLIHI